MSLSSDLTLVEKALDALERREVRVLVWGLVDGALGETEVTDVLAQTLDTYSEIASNPACTLRREPALLKRLLDLALLVEIDSRPGEPRRYRTRMAEGIRLLVRLRQLTARHARNDDWTKAPNLVADFRLLWRPRRYPRRDLPAGAVYDTLADGPVGPCLPALNLYLREKNAQRRWARFQVTATARILKSLQEARPSGTLVAAGTGSGKTLAFYLPALTWLASWKHQYPTRRGVRILAVYPRNELLKDQLREVFDQARAFDDFLGPAGAMPISVGVLYGDTPYTAKSVAQKWARSVCPYFRCPTCDGDMALRGGTGAAAAATAEGLVCQRPGCGTTVGSDHLRLTRHAMRDDPPDILFTSVEMLNRSLSDSTMRHLFGLGPEATGVPALMLLDEVHIYTGTYGAQVAYLLRRWSHLSGYRTSFVGLSATLADGQRFFAHLTGLDLRVVEEISPQPDDMEAEGAEYMLALRGDPVSQTSLLSTSIQALMLGSRLLDTSVQFSRDQRPFAGWRSFAFADQVDATNRLFYNLRDAEGFYAGGDPNFDRYPAGGLAHYRAPQLANRRRYEGGQDWTLPTLIGHDLSTRHRVERTTSYDIGVSHDSEIVIATAALEVGYDDEAVGLVLQHKAPREMAAFLQRKGRAGRTRHMRPWTLMVLSDYGRDRLAYQTYDRIFDPELPPRELPLGNRYVRRMQAVYALIDYLGVRMQASHPEGSVWRNLGAPLRPELFQHWPEDRLRRVRELAKSLRQEIAQSRDLSLTQARWHQAKDIATKAAPGNAGSSRYEAKNWLEQWLRTQHLKKLLTAILQDETASERLIIFLQSALGLGRDEIEPLLWDHPRPLLLAAVPTALRRLSTNWRSGDRAPGEFFTRNPLPEFVPASLFSDLTLPEAHLFRPNAPNRSDALPVLQALGEFAPGKVSRRYDHSLWLAPTPTALVPWFAAAADTPTALAVAVDDWYTLDRQPNFYLYDSTTDSVRACAAFRPVAFHLGFVPKKSGEDAIQVQDTSNARLIWHSQIFGRAIGASFPVPSERVGIARLFTRVLVHTHASQAQATVRRFATGSQVGLRVRQGQESRDYRGTWHFEKDGQRCGLGFEIEADALCFCLSLPVSPHESLRHGRPATQRAARTARFQWEAQHGVRLAALEDNPFQRQWEAQVFQVAALAYAADRDVPLATAFTMLGSGQETAWLRLVLETIFQSPNAIGDEGSGDEGEPARLMGKLLRALGRVELLQALADLGRDILLAPIDATWDGWLGMTHRYTLGAAVLEAIQQACPQISTDDLIVDIEPGPLPDGCQRLEPELWISEVNPGGNGLIEQVVEALATDDTLFFRRIESALGESEFEIIDRQLRAVVVALGTAQDEDLVERVQAVRQATSSQDTQDALTHLRRGLVHRNQAVFHGFVAALSSRLLRPYTPPGLDLFLAELLTHWDRLEDTLGVEVDARVVCALFSREATLDEVFHAAGYELPTGDRATWRFSVLLGLLWARGHALRHHALPLPLRFQDQPAVTERLLLQPWLSPPDEPIAADDPDWLAQVHQRLIGQSRAALRVAAGADALATVMGPLVTQPVQLEYLNMYPRLVGITRWPGVVLLQLELAATV